MKLTIERAAALAAVSRVLGVVVRTTTMPILTHLLIQAEGSRLSVTACDLDMQATASAEASVATAGAITVPAADLHDILRSLPAGAEISMELNGPRMVVKCGRSTFRLPVLPSGDFPSIPPPGASEPAAIGSADLARLLEKTSFAMSKDSTRYALNGLYLHAMEIEGRRVLRAVATDGNRLALSDAAAPEGLASDLKFILPSKAVGEVRRLLADVTGDVTLRTDAAKAVLVIGDVTLTSKLIDGTYPDYARVIPTQPRRALSVDGELFGAALKRVAILGGQDKIRMVKLVVEAGQIKVTARDVDGGDAEELLECVYDGDAFELGFNAAFLLDVIGRLDGKDLALQADDPASPVKVLDGAASVFVLMPLRV